MSNLKIKGRNDLVKQQITADGNSTSFWKPLYQVYFAQ